MQTGYNSWHFHVFPDTQHIVKDVHMHRLLPEIVLLYFDRVIALVPTNTECLHAAAAASLHEILCLAVLIWYKLTSARG